MNSVLTKQNYFKNLFFQMMNRVDYHFFNLDVGGSRVFRRKSIKGPTILKIIFLWQSKGILTEVLIIRNKKTARPFLSKYTSSRNRYLRETKVPGK